MEITRVSQPNIIRTLPKQSSESDEVKNQKDLPIAAKEEKEVYIPTQKEEKQTGAYGNMTEKERNNVIAELKKESEKLYDSMKTLIEKLLNKQGFSYEDFEKGQIDLRELEVDDETRAEAAAAIAEDGPFGAEAVSERIVQFAMALSGGDPSRLEIIKKAINDGFGAVKDIVGELPEVSLKTYDLIMEKLNKWEQEKIENK
jgi:uncharacterized coiled-coil protein SlyX